MPQYADPIRAADAAILDYLADERLAFRQVLAYRLDWTAGEIETRFDALENRGLIEQVSHDGVYRVTETARETVPGLGDDDSRHLIRSDD